MTRWVLRQIKKVLPLALLGALAVGCVIAEPEPLEPPERVPPRALLEGATPAFSQIVTTSSTGLAREFSVPFVSEDLGELVIGRLFLNYPNDTRVGYGEATPGSLTDTERVMTIAWDELRSVAAGCYSITMTITHAENYSQNNQKPIDADKTAFVTWWVVHDIDPQLVNLDECIPTDAPLF